MAQGRIVADGPAQISLSDQEELREANVLPPKLVEFSKLMNWGTCPSDALQARNLILESRIVDG